MTSHIAAPPDEAKANGKGKGKLVSTETQPEDSGGTLEEEAVLEDTIPLNEGRQKGPRMALVMATSKVFDPAILIVIMISSIMMALQSPTLDPASKMAMVLEFIDIAANLIFLCEMTIKMIAFGVFRLKSDVPLKADGKKYHPYFREVWNYIDFVSVVTGILSLLLQLISLSTKSLQLVRTIRMLRVMRPLRLVRRYKGIRLIVEALLAAIPTILGMTSIMALFYFGFAVLFVDLMKGQMWSCSLDPTGTLRTDINTHQDCLAAGGLWQQSNDNFDNFLSSLVTLLHCGNGVGVSAVLFQIQSLRGIDLQPRLDSSPGYVSLFVSFVFFGNFFLQNLLIGILIDQYSTTKAELAGTGGLTTEERKASLALEEVFLRPEALIPKPPLMLKGNFMIAFRHKLQKVIESRIFNILIFILILTNTVQLCAAGAALSSDSVNKLQVVSTVFVFIFNVDVCLKLLTYLLDFFNDNWNTLDLCVVIGSDLSLFADLITGGEGVLAQIFRIFRVGRVLRLARWAFFLRSIFTTVWKSLTGLFNVLVLLALVIFMYACLGMGSFGTVAMGSSLNENANFGSFGDSVLLLFRVATGEQWHLIMYDTVSSRSGCTNDVQSAADLQQNGPQGCGSILGYFYFFSFVWIVTIVLMNLIAAVLIDAYATTSQVESLHVFSAQLKHISDKWKQLDPAYSGLAPLDKVLEVLLEVDEPVGYKGRTRKMLIHQLRYLRVFSGRRLHFRDLIIHLAKRSQLYIKGDFEKNIATVRLLGPAVDGWYDAFPNVPKENPKDAMLLAHLIIARHVLKWINRKRRQWHAQRTKAGRSGWIRRLEAIQAPAPSEAVPTSVAGGGRPRAFDGDTAPNTMLVAELAPLKTEEPTRLSPLQWPPPELWSVGTVADGQEANLQSHPALGKGISFGTKPAPDISTADEMAAEVRRLQDEIVETSGQTERAPEETQEKPKEQQETKPEEKTETPKGENEKQQQKTSA